MLLKSSHKPKYALVSNVFIEKYMKDVQGDFLKVYLWLLRLAEERTEDVTVADLADRLDCMEKDVKRALKSLEKQGILRLELQNGRINCIELVDLEAKEASDEAANVYKAPKESDGSDGFDGSNGFGIEEVNDGGHDSGKGVNIRKAEKDRHYDGGKAGRVQTTAAAWTGEDDLDGGSQIDNAGQYDGSPADRAGWYAGTQADNAGQYDGNPADSAGQNSDSQTDSAGRYADTQADNAGRYVGAHVDNAGQSSGLHVDNAEHNSGSQMDNAGQNGATHAGNAGQYGDVQDVSNGEAAFEGEDEAGYDHHYPQFEADSDPGYRYMVTAAESYLGRTLTPTDIALFDRLHKEYDFSYELIEYLVELCVELGKKSNRYMETVALSWVKEGKLSVAELKEERKAFRKENRAVMKAFGITGRMLGDKERSYVDKWLKEQHFTLDVIIEACDHTMTAIKSPSFEYTDTILTSWKKAGVATVEDARRVSEEFKNAAALKHGKGGRGQSSRGGSSGTAGAPNRFHNFEQRNIDYDALLADEIGLKKRKKTKQKDNEKDEAAGAQQAGQKAEPSGEMAELFGQEDTEARRLWKPDKHLSELESC